MSITRAQINTASALGVSLAMLQHPSDAIEVLAEAHEACKKLLGPDDPTSIALANNLASQFVAMSRFQEALPLLRHVCEKIDVACVDYG